VQNHVQTPVQHPSEAPANWDAQAEAERILGVGDTPWYRKDDYGERVQEFANTLQGLDAQQRQELTAAILDKDTNALNSWLNPSVMDGLDQRELGMVGEALAGAYNSGHPVMANFDAPANPTFGGHEMHQRNPLDGAVLGFNSHGYSDALGRAQDARAFVELMSASSGPEAAQFRADYANHLIEQYVLNDRVDVVTRDAAAGIAAQMLGNDTTRPDLVVDALSGMSEGDRARFLERVARSSGLFGSEIIEALASSDLRVDPADVRLQDGLGLLMSAVARSADPAAGELAVEF